MSLLASAQRMAARFQREACCPWCLQMLADEIASDPAGLEVVRRDLHPFWNSCASALSFPEMQPTIPFDELCEQKRVDLRRAQDACVLHCSSQLFRRSDILHKFIQAICQCLHLCLTVGESSAVRRSAGGKRVFNNDTGNWPTTREPLFPYGEHAGVQSMLFWSRSMSSALPLFLLGDMLRIAHPLVFFEITYEQEPHERLISSIITILADYARPWVNSVGSGRRPPSSTDLMAKVEAAVLLLSSVQTSPDAHPNSLMEFANGAEVGVFYGLELVLFALVRSGDSPQLIDVAISLCVMLYHYMPTPDASQLLYPGILQFVASGDSITLFGVLHQALNTMDRNRSTCTGPECTTVVSSDRYEDPHFLACGRCETARYCSRGCQVADWKRGSQVPHRDVCPLLRRMLAVAKVDMEQAAFTAAVSALDWDDSDLRKLSLFTLNSLLLPMEVLVRAADIHIALMAGQELSDDSNRALESVDHVRRILRDKKAGVVISRDVLQRWRPVDAPH